jgi:ABC-type histidine transport system ATPase subunit
MRIISLTAENVKRLKAVSITPDGDVVVIAGRNGQGKTSVLDSIWYALGGSPDKKETPRPIRDGEESASVTLDLGDLIVTRTWKGDATTLKVGNKDGATYSSPQKMLDQLIGRLSFDPLAFTQQDAKTQLATLLDLVELPFDPDELNAQRKTLYDNRTVVGRDLTTLSGQLAGLPVPSEDTPTEEISAASILAEQSAHRDQLDNYRRTESALEGSQRDFNVAENLVVALEAQLAEAKADVLVCQADLTHAEDRLAEKTLPADIDFAAELAAVEETNRLVRARNAYAETYEKAAGMTARVVELTAGIAALDKSKADALAAAKMPIDGLAFDEEGVTYNAIPFGQCSSAEQLRVSMAMAFAANPEIRIVLIRDGSLLDSEGMKLIAEMAAEQDAQVWIERVDESGEVGVVIEDGSVKA